MTATVAVCMVTVLAAAATPATAQTENDWRHAFATYLMAAGMDGDVGIGALTADANVR